MAFADPEREREYNRAYREANREKARERARLWRLENPERAREQNRTKKAKNPEVYRAISRRHYENNRDAVLERCRAWRAANPEKREAMRPPYDPEKQSLYNRAWRKRNPGVIRALNAKRRALERGASVGERVDRHAIYDRDGGRCHICGKKVARDRFTLDHLVPLVHGGAHVAENVRVAHGVCNSRRGPGRLPAQLILA